MKDGICVFFFIHFPVLPQITAKSRNYLNFQIMKVLMQMQIQLTLQNTLFVSFQKKILFKFKTRNNFLLYFIF